MEGEKRKLFVQYTRIHTTEHVTIERFGERARASGFVTNEGFAGFSAFDPRRDYAADFARFLAAPGARHLIMCHPGRVDAELERLDPATYSREQELEFLLSDRFEDVLARAPVTGA